MNVQNRVLSLQAAADFTGFSLGKFRYAKNKALLLEAGATVTEEGHWRIPVSALEAIGWVGVKAPKAEIATLRAEASHRGIFGRKKKQ
jgi:hypothetical protein